MLGRLKRFVARHKAKIIATALVIISLGETTVDTSNISEMISNMLPLIITMISLAIPILFLKYIMRFLEKILSGFR